MPRHRARIRVAMPVVVVAIALLAAGCGTDRPAAQTSPQVVASTDVWGSVAAAVAGSHYPVKSLVTSAVDDPHSFEASPADAAAIADATLVVYNGGGYDQWAADVVKQHPGVPAVDAYALEATPPGGAPANEHVFYDLTIAKSVAAQIAERLAVADPGTATEYRTSATDFATAVDVIAASESAIGRNHPGAAVVSTEPVAHYLLTGAGVADRTPEGFASAAEDGHDPAPADLAAMLDLITGHHVGAVIVNPQTETPASKQVVDAARAAGVPTVTVTETLPAGKDYLTWQADTVGDLATKLGAAAPAAGR